MDTNKNVFNNSAIVMKQSVEPTKAKKEIAVKKIETIRYEGFYLVNEYATDGIEKKLLSSSIISNEKEDIMSSNNIIDVIELKDSSFLISSSEQTIIVEVVDGELQVLNSVSRVTPGEMYKVTDFLKDNKVVILTDYNPDEKRNFEYLFDYTTGKRISSGFDSIDEVNGKLKVTYGLATGNLDLEGNFVMEPDEDYPKPKGIFARLFNKGRC